MAKELPIKEHRFHEGYFPPALKGFGIALAAFGFVLLYMENLVGIIPVLLALFIMVSAHGFHFKLEEKTYLKYFSVLSFRFGKWKSIDNPKGILLSKKNISESAQSRFGQSLRTKVSLWEISIRTKDDEIFFHETENIKEACSLVLLLMAAFEVFAYSKYVAEKRKLNYAALRKGMVAFGDVLIKK